ncbi:MAG: hypothetical protein HC876_12610 [Chloroflexaceae bacterium]|nr:hypothetical protein [Chloroflexaceae bacterium]
MSILTPLRLLSIALLVLPMLAACGGVPTPPASTPVAQATRRWYRSPTNPPAPTDTPVPTDTTRANGYARANGYTRAD